MKRATGVQALAPGAPIRYHVVAKLNRELSVTESRALPGGWLVHPGSRDTIVGVELDTCPGEEFGLVAEALRAAAPQDPPVWLNVQTQRA